MTPDLSYHWEGAREQCEENKWDGKIKQKCLRGLNFVPWSWHHGMIGRLECGPSCTRRFGSFFIANSHPRAFQQPTTAVYLVYSKYAPALDACF